MLKPGPGSTVEFAQENIAISVLNACLLDQRVSERVVAPHQEFVPGVEPGKQLLCGLGGKLTPSPRLQPSQVGII